MAGAAAVVDEVTPERLPGDGIQHVAVAVVQPDGLCNVDVALQRPGVEQPLVLGQLAQRVGAGDIGGAVQIGTAAVHQQEAFPLQLGVVFLGGVVVHHGSVSAVGGDGAKALHNELVLCTAVLVQDLVHGQLGQLLTGSQTLFQLFLEPDHGHGVPDVGFLGVGQLHFVLDAFHGQQGVGLVFHGERLVLFQGLIHGKVDGSRVGQHGLGLGLGRQELEHVVVLGNGHAVLFELGCRFRLEAGGVEEENRAVFGDIAVGHGVGGALDIHGTEVEQPGQVVQLAHQLGGAAQLLELCPQLAQLLGGGEACVLFGQDPSRGGGQGRAALGPELVLQIQRFNPAVLCFQSFLQPAHQPAGGRQATQAQLAALGQDLGAIFFHGGHARLAHLLELDLGASDLFLGLHKIAAIGPDSTLGHGDDKVGVLAVETGEIGQGGVVLRQILAGVGVAHGDQVNIHTVCFHGGAQGGQTLRNRIHAHWVKPSFQILHFYSCRKNVRRRWFAASYCNIPARRMQSASPLDSLYLLYYTQ